MKIERISENQIKCILTKEDLAARQIRLAELVYGNEKTRELFQDLMQQAYADVGFEVDGAPLMIEAVPTSPESIILLITKVDNPEELDSRFSRFSQENAAATGTGSEGISSLGDLIDFFARLARAKRSSDGSVPSVPGQEGLDSVAQAMAQLQDEKRTAGESGTSRTPPALEVSAASVHGAAPAETAAQAGGVVGQEAAGEGEPNPDEELYDLTKFYLIRDLPTAIRAARAAEQFDGISSLYKNPEEENYYLLLQKAESPAEQFNRVCNILSEYALSVDFTPGIEELFGEHMETILRGQALNDLRAL